MTIVCALLAFGCTSAWSMSDREDGAGDGQVAPVTVTRECEDTLVATPETDAALLQLNSLLARGVMQQGQLEHRNTSDGG